ncbi:MAG: DUF4112 domain-containing protein [Microvirga sp.]
MTASRAAFFDAVKAAGPSETDSLARITFLAKLLDSAFVIPGLNRSIGIDALIGAVPVVGDAVSAALSGYIIWEARQLGLPRWKIARMLGNVAIDTAIGAIPVAGDVFDVFFKANMRNLRIIHDHLGRDGHGRRRAPKVIDGTAVRVETR